MLPPLLSPAPHFQAEELRTGDCGGKRLESEIQGDQPRNSSESKKPWKKMGG